jgi:hypothetical protein
MAWRYYGIRSTAFAASWDVIEKRRRRARCHAKIGLVVGHEFFAVLLNPEVPQRFSAVRDDCWNNSRISLKSTYGLNQCQQTSKSIFGVTTSAS